MSSTTIDPPSTAPTAGGDVFAEVLAVVSDQLSRVVDVPTFGLDEARLQARLSQALAVRASVDELIARLVREVDDRNLAVAVGASSTRAHLQAEHRMSRPQAAGIMAQARAVSERTEPLRRAWAAGRISGEQAVVIGKAIELLSPSIDPATIETAQHDLVKHAQTLNYPQLRCAANHLVEVVDPEGADATLAEYLEAEETRAWQATMFRGSCGADGIARERVKLTV